MELKIKINYKQILQLVQQLPKRDREKLSVVLQSEIEADKSAKSLQEIILNAPTWTEADFRAYNEARGHINQSRIA